MARGLLAGLIWGSVVSVGGAAVVSLSTPMPQPPAVSDAAPEAMAPSVTEPAPETPASDSTAEIAAPVEPAEPETPGADTLAALETADTTPTPAPEIGSAQDLDAPMANLDNTPRISSPDEDTLVASEPQALPSAPAVTAPQVATEPASPTPPAPAAETVPQRVPTAELEREETDDAEEPVANASVAADPDPAEDASDNPSPIDAMNEDQAEAAAIAGLTQPAEDRVAPEQAEDASTETETETETAPRIAALPRVEDASEPEPEAEPATSAPSIGAPVQPLTDRNRATSALPRITAEPAPGLATPETGEDAERMRPIDAYAAPFENAGDRPLMSIVLIDGQNSIGSEALAGFPYPLSFAIDPSDPAAAEKMARYRAAGFEVLALIDMPEQGTAQDAETVLEVGLGKLTEVVAVMEGLNGGFQNNREMSDQVTAILSDKGYGLLTQNAGLNTVQKLAVREGVPARFVFRDFDGDGQAPTVMRRFLDQAAFRAGQEGGVIMLGRVTPDTISALLLWGLQDRASRVALAPVSAVLMAPEVPQ